MMESLPAVYAQRLSTLRGTFDAHGIEAVLLVSPSNRRYFSGYTGLSGYLLICETSLTLIVSVTELITTVADHGIHGVADSAPWLPVVVLAMERPWAECVREVLQSAQVRHLGIEADHMTVTQHGALRYACGRTPTIVPIAGVAEPVRALKDDTEIMALRQAADLTDRAFGYFLSLAAVGQTPRALSWAVERMLRENGADGLSFETLIAAGPDGAAPHPLLSHRPLEPGDSVIIDLGARVNGYCADMTRTVLVGGGSEQNEERFRVVYGAVLAANQAVTRAARVGQRARDLDALARAIIGDAGYAAQFTHGLGHSVGLDIHEQPYLSAHSQATLAAGMVITNEPGIYLPGWGGVRIEDLLLIRDDDAEVLSRSARDITII